MKRLIRFLFLHLQHLPMPGHKVRPLLVKLGGVKIQNPKKTFIGEDVTFDTLYPEKIVVEEGVRVTKGVSILTHYLDPQKGRYKAGEVRIKRKVHIGWNAIICKPVTIGEGAIVGAGSVVTKDIPDYEVWAGNPARCIKKRERK